MTTPTPRTARRAWTTREIATLRKHYPIGGINAVIEHLPHRSRAAIYCHAAALGLRCPGQPQVREHWPLDPAIDDAIRLTHQRPTQRGDIVRLAARVGRPLWWVSRRARDMGFTTPRFREANWSDAEIAILRANSHLAPAAVQRALRRQGFRRTTTAVAVMRKRLGIKRTQADAYSCRQAAMMLGMDASTMLREIRTGYLRARPNTDYQTRSDGATAQYVITDRDLREYIISHPVRLNLRKLPAGHVPWFVDLLAGRAGDGMRNAVRETAEATA